MERPSEKELWENVKEMMGESSKKLGTHWSYELHNDPKRLAFVLSRYKFAAKMIGKNKSILELGCSEGIGAPILSEFTKSYTGVDLDEIAINTATEIFSNQRCRFIKDDFRGNCYGRFDSIVSMEVIEYISPEDEKLFFDTVQANLGENGVCIIGTPNITSEQYSSDASKMGHVNLYSADSLYKTMGTVFNNVFVFGMNDEIVHTGFHPMAQFLIAIGCYKKL